MKDIREELKERKAELTRKQTENNVWLGEIEDAENEIIATSERLLVGQEALAFLETLANSRRGHMKGKIESVITEAMRLIYDDSYSCELEYTVKNNRSHLEIWMVRQTSKGPVRRSMGGFGGGMADTMCVPMRLMVLIGAKQTDRVCVVDECWKHMDLERIPSIGQFVRLLTDKLNMQVVFTTHHRELEQYADKSFLVSEEDGKADVQVFG